MTAPACAISSTSPTSCGRIPPRSTIFARGGKNIVLNCGYGRGYSVLELLDAVQRVSGRVLDIRARDRRAGDIPGDGRGGRPHPADARLDARP